VPVRSLWRHARISLVRVATLGVLIGSTLLLPGLVSLARAQTRLPNDQFGADHDPPACVVGSNSLWSLAQCCSRSLRSYPDCRYYSEKDEYIILKDNSLRKPAAYLIIPTLLVAGIEDEQIFSSPVVNFWEFGWQEAQRFVEKPAAEMALAINSIHGRTQNQFHIHIACVLAAVAESLAGYAAEITGDPVNAINLTLGPARHIYRVITATSLSGPDSPFRLVAAMPGAQGDMREHSIAVVGSAIPGTYYVLDTVAEGNNRGAAEELLDQRCGR
jgi:CDP-diacylglycerol pyrophosphatase